jgi:hypothetical protein
MKWMNETISSPGIADQAEFNHVNIVNFSQSSASIGLHLQTVFSFVF